MKKNYTSFFLTAMVALFCVTTIFAQSEEGPIEITSFADSTNITAGDNFPRAFKQGDTIHIEGSYGNIANAKAVWATYDIYKSDWSGLEYTALQPIANDSIGTLDGKISFDYVIPMDAGLKGQFDDNSDPENVKIAFPILQVRIQYEPEVNTYWNIFIDVQGEEAEATTPLTVLTIDGLDPTTLIDGKQGESVNVMGTYDTQNATDVSVGYLVFNPDWSQAYANTVVIADAASGNLDGTINYDYTIPADAPLHGSVDDVSDPNMPATGHYLLQVRVNYDPPLDIFYNANLSVGEGGKTTSFYVPILEGLEISPNPATHALKIVTPLAKEKHVSIYDASGKVLFEKDLAGDFLDISMLNTGLHFIRVEQDGKVGGQKIMVE